MPGTAADATRTLVTGEHPATSWPGIATAAAVLAGLAANAGLGWWGLDPVIALGIAALAVREGREALEGGED